MKKLFFLFIALSIFLVSCGSNKNPYPEDKFFHNDTTINHFINIYNETAVNTITEDMVEKGAYDFSASISVNQVYCLVYANDNGLFFTLSETSDTGNENIKSVSFDILTALSPELTDEGKDEIWNELLNYKEKDYDFYSNPYIVNDIELSYSEDVFMDGSSSYKIKISVKDYNS